MQEIFNFKNIFIGIFLLCFFVPCFKVEASSDVASIWAEKSGKSQVSVFPVDNASLGKFAEFLVYLLFAFLGIFAFVTIFVGRLKMFLAGSSADSYDSAKYMFISGIVAFVVVIVIYVSLDNIFLLVEEWSARMA